MWTYSKSQYEPSLDKNEPKPTLNCNWVNPKRVPFQSERIPVWEQFDTSTNLFTLKN